jgi:hypothetical protein
MVYLNGVSNGMGLVPADSGANIKIYNWDGQTLCSNPDFLRDKTSLTSEVPCFCSNFSPVSSSNNY